MINKIIVQNINRIVDKAVKEDWYNKMTTSDLQGVVMAEVMNMGKDNEFIMSVSDIILEKIYIRAGKELEWS